MTLVLSNDDVESLLTMRECIDVLEGAYVELHEGRGVNRVRSDCLVPSRGDAVYSLKSMDGIIPSLGVGAVRIDSDVVTWPRDGNATRRVKVPAAPNGRYVGLVLLFSTETGEPLAIMPDGIMQRMRVGAANGLGIEHLARRDAKSVGILGSGWQAGAQLMAACAVRNIDSIRCYSPNAVRCEAFAAAMSDTLGVVVSPVRQPEDAVRSADIVLCATNSIDNVFFERWIEPGVHLSAIKISEIEAAAIGRADRVVLHAHELNPIHVVARNLAVPEINGNKGWALGKKIDFGRLPTLPELLAGKVAGRRADADVTCFINNLGLGFQFAAVGAVVYRKAKEQCLGRDLPTDWFTQTVHP